MPVDSKHYDYETHIDDWLMMRDVEAGARIVKDKGETYLTKPLGFTTQGDGGEVMYTAYRDRAQVPDIMPPTLAGMVGVIHRVDAQIEGLEEGKPLNSFWEKCSRDGLTLEAFHRRITTEILLTGRYSIFVDVAQDGEADALPYFVGYTAERLINWSDDARNLFVLDESTKEQGTEDSDEFAWNDVKKYRVLRLQDGVYSVQTYENTDPKEQVDPQVRGGEALKEIPFVVANGRELSMAIDQPPLIGVANATLAIYRLDADYRHQLYSSGQETLFISGQTDDLPRVVGAGVIIGLPPQSTAAYVGPSGSGMAAHRIAIMDERQAAVAAGVRLFDTQGRSAESGDALRLRASAQTATLTTIAQSSAAALEKALRFAAQFVGQDPKEVVVKPNLKFVETTMTPREAADLVTVWQSGAISKQTLYEDLQRGEIASQERTFEEEQDLIDQEAIDQPLAQGAGSVPSPNDKGFGNDLNRLVEPGTGIDIQTP